jgi:peptide/nickel transport system substrate-binding protein
MRDARGYWIDKANIRQVTRRRFIGGAAIAGVGATGLTLVGCGNDDDNGNGPAPTPTAAPGETPAPTATPTPADAAKQGGILRTVFLGNGHADANDVHRNFADPVSWLSNFVYNKLVRYENPDAGIIEGDLAEAFETPDAQTYTFKIRPDVFWQDTALTNGRQFTAEDIVWHFERQASNKLSDGSEVTFRHASFYGQIEHIDMPDEFTVVATLERPNGTFLDELSSYRRTVPNRETTEAFEADWTRITEEAMPATGAYTLKQWRSDEDMKLERNPGYFKADEVLLDGWIYPRGLFEDPSAHRIAFEQKQVDSFSSPDPSLTMAIIEANRQHMYEVLTGVANPVFMHLNMNQQFQDVRLVRAVNAAFDRRRMIEAFHLGLGQVSGIVTWIQEGYALPPTELIEQEGYRVSRDEDIQLARELWAAAEGPSLGEVNITYEASWAGVWPDTSQVLAAMLNDALGVSQFVSRRSTYDEDIIPNLGNGTFPNWVAWTSQVSGPDPRQELFNTFHSQGAGNFQGINNPDLDRLLEDALLTADYEVAVDLVRQAQRIIHANGQFGNCMLYNYISRSAGWNYLYGNNKVPPQGTEPGEGWNITAAHLAPERAWIDPDDPSFSGRPAVSL